MRFLVLVSLLLLAGTYAAAASARPYLVLNDHFYVRPTFTFQIATSTTAAFIGKSHWLVWKKNGATARAVFFTDDCKPTCFTGHYRARRARVRLFNPSSCRGRTVFSSFTVLSLTGVPLLEGSFRRLGYLKHC